MLVTRALAALAFLTALGVPRLAAQEAGLTPFSRVRVIRDTRVTTGVLLRISPETLTVAVMDQVQLAIPRSEITKVEVFTGAHRKASARGAARGLVAGALVGGVIGGMFSGWACTLPVVGGQCSGSASARSAVAGAVVSGMFGAMLGSLSESSPDDEGWSVVP